MASKKRRKLPAKRKTRAAAKQRPPLQASTKRRAAPPGDPWDDVPEDPETIFHLKEAARHFDAAYNVRRPRTRRGR